MITNLPIHRWQSLPLNLAILAQIRHTRYCTRPGGRRTMGPGKSQFRAKKIKGSNVMYRLHRLVKVRLESSNLIYKYHMYNPVSRSLL